MGVTIIQPNRNDLKMSADAIIGAIPARFAASRLPGKPLREIAGRPMIEHVYRRALRATTLERVVVLTDDRRIAEVVEGFGGDVQMTPQDCRSGTDRIASVAGQWRAKGVVNIQGDEPLIDPEAIDSIARHLLDHDDAMVTLAAPAAEEDVANPNVVKVVTDLQGYALYFSRSGIPFARQGSGASPRKHVGIYGYRRDTVLRLADLAPTPLEISESLEQLRALENGIAIRVLAAAAARPGVDTAEDLARVEALLRAEGQSTSKARGGEAVP